MIFRLLTGSLLLAVLGCLVVGCSDDTRRITSPSTIPVHPDPLSTSLGDLDNQSTSLFDDGFVFDPWNTDGTDDESLSAFDDPTDRFDAEGDVSGKPIDKGSH